MTEPPGAAARGGAGDTPRAVTIARVAEAAEVSRATVSRVMNGRTSVDPRLAARVRRAAHELGYHPSTVARSLALGRTGVIGMVVPDLANPMFQAVLRGLSDAAAEEDSRVLVADSHEHVEGESLLALETRRRCDGLVLCAPRMPEEQLRDLAERLSPMILVNRFVQDLAVPSVGVDHSAGMSSLVDHLVELGHRRAAYLAGPSTSVADRERRAALKAAEDRLEIVELSCGAMFEDGSRAVEEALAAEVTAILGYNDLVAFGALGRLHELGIDIPGELSVCGFDDIRFARFAAPPLTTVQVPKVELGREAWRRLSAALAGAPLGPATRFAPHLQVRGSTGPAQGR